MMLKVCKAILLVALAVSVAYALDIQLVITKKTVLKGELEDLITFGGIKEMTCDANGNIFSPSNRKYGSAINAIVRFSHDAGSFRTFSIDTSNGLASGTIADFDLGANGELFVLARRVLKYSDVKVPLEFGENFVIEYDQTGKALSKLELRIDTNNFKPTGLAVLQGGEFLVVGDRRENGKTFIIAELFQKDGSLKARFDLSEGGTKTSKGRTVESPRVFHPTAIRANSSIYVLRGTTVEPIYVLSEAGQLVKTIRLKPAEDLEFDSPKILHNELIVREHPPFSDEETGIRIRTGPRRVNLPVFNLESGKIMDRYYWYNETAGLACYGAQSLTFIGQDESTMPIEWTLFETGSAGTAKRKGTAAGR